jgi:hypothetical protein
MRILALIFVLAAAGAHAADEKKSCSKDADCPGDQVCEKSRCVPPSGPPPGWGSSKPQAPAAATGRGAVREDEAAQGAGMALQYTKNTWPLSIADRPLVVAPGMTEAQLLIGRDISNANAHPFGASIYARYGVSDRIHAGLNALDLCFSDCGDFFSAISFGAGYAVIAEHDQNLVPAVGFAIENNPAGVTVPLQAGFLYAYRLSSKMQLAVSGSLALDVIGRDNAGLLTGDPFALQIQPRFELAPRFALLPSIGFSIPLRNTDFWQVPLGLGVLYIVDRAVDVGAQFTFGNIISHDISTIGGTFSFGGLDFRTLSVYGTVRL